MSFCAVFHIRLAYGCFFVHVHEISVLHDVHVCKVKANIPDEYIPDEYIPAALLCFWWIMQEVMSLQNIGSTCSSCAYNDGRLKLGLVFLLTQWLLPSACETLSSLLQQCLTYGASRWRCACSYHRHVQSTPMCVCVYVEREGGGAGISVPGTLTGGHIAIQSCIMPEYWTLVSSTCFSDGGKPITLSMLTAL